LQVASWRVLETGQATCPGEDTLKRELQPSRELAGLRARLAEAEETLRAIHSGEVDAVVVAGKQGQRLRLRPENLRWGKYPTVNAP